MSNAAAGVRLGGGGYSYGDYSLPSSKKPAPNLEEESGKKLLPRQRKKFLNDQEAEVFLFTIRDPARSIIGKLMDLLSVYGTDAIPDIDIPLAETGPLGYTSVHAFRPTFLKTPDSMLKSVIK